MTEAPGRARPTIVTLARSAGVSASTVSRALRGDARISLAVRARIARLAAEAGYLPNIMARSLSSGRSGLLGLVLGPLGNPFYAQLFEALVRAAGARGQRFIVIHAGHGPIGQSTADALLHYRVDGCVVTSADLCSRAADLCAQNGVPLVMINRVPRRHASSVSCDNVDGARQLARHLRAGGHCRAAVLHSGPSSPNSIARERGFDEGFVGEGARVVRRLEAHPSYEGGFAAGEVLARLPVRGRPDCVFAVSDVIAMGAMDALRAGGLRVPEDVSVVGFDAIPEGSRPAYALTSFRQPVTQMVAHGLELLAARIAQPGLPDESVLLPGEIVLGWSSRGEAARPRLSGSMASRVAGL
jgi:DNA-binding LacI/PurR family transcriptional regulator